MKVFIITEGYQSTGYGHITRCLSLYQAFKERNINPQLIINGDKTAAAFLADSNYLLLNWLENPDMLFEKIDNSDIVIADSYKADEKFYEELYGRTRLLAVIDDYVRLNYKAHIIINGTIGSENYWYKRNGDVNYLLGAKYIPLRKEFRNVEDKLINPDVKNILITMGGQDIRNLTELVLDRMLSEFPDVNYFVVAKENFNISIAKYSHIKNVEFIFDAAAGKMKELMLKCDVAITAAGQTLYELACTGIPSIAIVVADNQIKNIQGWVANGFIAEELYYDDSSLLDKICASITKLKDKETRSLISLKGKSAIDGRGPEAILDTIFSVYAGERAFYFRDAAIDDAKTIYELSTDPAVRVNSINQGAISWDEHTAWLSKTLKNENYVFKLCFTSGGLFIGQVRFSLEGDTAVVSISIVKAFRGKGFSHRILQAACHDIFAHYKNINVIIAYIKPDNISSVKGFIRAGFVLRSMETINNENYNLYNLIR